MATYLGFSTFGATKGFQLTDKELVNRDLINHIYTIPGERLLMPGFGTRIPLMAFEPLDQKTLSIIEEDLRAVVAYDPRVELIDIAVMALPNNNAVVALLDLKYVELNEVGVLRLDIDTRG